MKIISGSNNHRLQTLITESTSNNKGYSFNYYTGKRYIPNC